MVIRVFRPTIHRGKGLNSNHFSAKPRGATRLVAIRDHRAAHWQARNPSSTEYLFVTVWHDVASIRAFAGARWEEAVIAPEEEHLLNNTWIGHYEAMAIPDGV